MLPQPEQNILSSAGKLASIVPPVPGTADNCFARSYLVSNSLITLRAVPNFVDRDLNFSSVDLLRCLRQRLAKSFLEMRLGFDQLLESKQSSISG
jgi:hypothetical protein